MTTRIEIYEKARPDNVVASSTRNRRLTAPEIRKELRELKRWLDPTKYAHRIIHE